MRDYEKLPSLIVTVPRHVPVRNDIGPEGPVAVPSRPQLESAAAARVAAKSFAGPRTKRMPRPCEPRRRLSTSGMVRFQNDEDEPFGVFGARLAKGQPSYTQDESPVGNT